MNRATMALITEYLQYFPCVALVGPRQCGKTTTTRMLPPDWRHFDLERASDYQLIKSDPDGFLRNYNDKVAIDEAQVLVELFPALRVAIDEQRDKPGRFVLTGSSSPNLQRNLSESLAGRVGLIEMSPLSFAEVEERDNHLLRALVIEGVPVQELSADVKSVTPERSQLLRDFWFQGGYPEPWLRSRSQPRFRKAWMENYLKTYLERDLRRLFPGIDGNRYRTFLGMLASMSGSIVNMSDLGRSLAVSQPTIRDYIDIAHGTFLWRRLFPFERNVSKRIVKHPYGHFRDSGLLHSLLYIPSREALATHAVVGRSWQSFVIEEVLRTFDCGGISYRPYFYRTAAGAEVDLVLEGDFGVVPFEIKLSSSVTLHELRPLRDFMKEHGCPRGVVIHNGDRIFQWPDNIVGLPFLLL